MGILSGSPYKTPLFMKKVINTIKADKIVYFCFLAGICLLILSTVLIGLFYTKLPPILPLYNQLPWGEARLGPKPQVFIPIGIGMFFYGINISISYALYGKIPLLSRVIMTAALLFCLFIFLLMARTVDLVI